MASVNNPPLPAQSQYKPTEMVTNGVKLVGESVLPGASLLLDGKVPSGLVHALVGFGARAAFGPIGLLVVAADSYSKSVTNKHLWVHVSDADRSLVHRGEAPAPEMQAPPS
jgi:hypothetical protein